MTALTWGTILVLSSVALLEPSTVSDSLEMFFKESCPWCLWPGSGPQNMYVWTCVFVCVSVHLGVCECFQYYICLNSGV